MVVLEGGGMLTTNGNQYIQPDYLSPLPTTVSIYITYEILASILISSSSLYSFYFAMNFCIDFHVFIYSWMRKRVH